MILLGGKNKNKQPPVLKVPDTQAYRKVEVHLRSA
jgi:hypothetical protein